MTPNKISTMLHRRTNRITRVLIYAFLEWTLIFLLLLNSLFSYFILKFALYFGLKPPCFLCSRLDHFLDSRSKEKHNKKFSSFNYTDIICDQHAAEISKIGYCSHHRKLVESQNMCQNCSSHHHHPTSTDPEGSNRMAEIGADTAKKCSCCDGVINPITNLDFVIKERELLGGCFSDQNVKISSDHSDDQTKFEYQVLGDCTEEEEDDVILEAEKEPLLVNNDKDKDKDNDSFTTRNLCSDVLPQHLEFFIDHDDYRLIPVEFVDDDSIKGENKSGEANEGVGDEKKKKDETSENCREFELVFEGDDLLLPRCEVTPTKDLPSIQEEEEESMIESLQFYKDEEILEDSESFEWHFEGGQLLAAAGCETENSQINEEKIDNSESSRLVCEGDDFVSGCEIDSKDSPKEEEESLIDKVQEVENEEDSEILQPIQEEEKERESEYSPLKEQEERANSENELILDEQERDYQAAEADNQGTATETHSTVTVSEEENVTHLKSDEPDTEEQNQKSADKPLIDESEDDIASHLMSHETETETERKHDPTAELLNVVDESATLCEQEICNIVDNAVSNEVSNNCPHDAETSEGIISAEVGISRNEVEEERVPDTPTSSESLHKKLLLLERRESATEESLDGMTTISEQGSVGETIEKLKTDLLAERKTLRALFKELEEERNASAISANQTMAMITRLQEEKATMQMEASQYQRMMEEQSEYDQEALQMMNELVVKREKEKQELEKELEVYRKKVMDYEEREKMRILSRRRSRTSSASCSYGEESDGVSVDLNQETKDQEEEGGSPLHPNSQQENGHQDTPAETVLCLQDSLTGFEDERQAILEQLKVLEEKLFTLAEEEEEHFENMKPFEQFYEENGKEFDGNNSNGYGVDSNGYIHVNGQNQEERRMNGSMPKKLLLPLFDAAESLESPNGELLNGNDDGFHITKFELEKKRFALEEEVDQVHERLQALEADREFLKHCIGSIRKGDKGLDLLQEILQHLRDLKNVELQVVKNMDHCASV